MTSSTESLKRVSATNLSAFSASNLITPDRIRRDCAEALSATPPWADAWAVVRDDLDMDLDACMVALGLRSARRSGTSTKTSTRDENGGQWYVNVIFGAILCELTRFGNSLASNTNGKWSAAGALFYLKMTYAGAPKDNSPVTRLIMNAGAHEEVALTRGDHLTPHSERYLHPKYLRRTGAGKPEKAAREVSIGHARRCAEKAGLSDVEVQAYVANLRALFAFHDECHGLPSW